MHRIMLPCFAIAACTPSPQEVVMSSPSAHSEPVDDGSSTMKPSVAVTVEQAAQGPLLEPVSAAANPASADLAATIPATDGRRILSTAFVRVGPDGYLTVERSDGRTLVLRDVVMQPRDYCGTVASGKRYCGGYGEVVAAQPGGGAVDDRSMPVYADPADHVVGPVGRR